MSGGLHPDTLTRAMRAVYLHGFASSPRSSKAAFIANKLRAHGIETAIPDLNLPDFSTLTVTRMLDTTEQLLDASPDPAILIGSSLGGFVAVNAAVRRRERVQRLVLLAPALEFADRRMRDFGPETIAEWKRSGVLHVFHYAYGRMVPVQYGLYLDASRYDALHARPAMATLVLQGLRDSAVNPETVKAWCAARLNVELRLLDDDHQMTASLDEIWKTLAAFLGLHA